MAIEDVIHDLRVYFDSLGKPVQFTAHMGGLVNPSYLAVKYEDQEQILTFWSVTGGSEAEKRLAVAFRDDISEWLNALETKPCPEAEPEKAQAVEPEQPRNGRRSKSNASGAEFKPIQ